MTLTSSSTCQCLDWKRMGHYHVQRSLLLWSTNTPGSYRDFQLLYVSIKTRYWSYNVGNICTKCLFVSDNRSHDSPDATPRSIPSKFLAHSKSRKKCFIKALPSDAPSYLLSQRFYRFSRQFSFWDIYVLCFLAVSSCLESVGIRAPLWLNHCP